MAGEERIAAGGGSIRDDELCFLGRGEELELYRALRAELLSRWPNTELRPRRTQTGFAERYIYAVASPSMSSAEPITMWCVNLCGDASAITATRALPLGSGSTT